MLEKISNINPDSAFKGEKKRQTVFTSLPKGQKHVNLGEDSITLSPSVHFLLGKNWQPVQLKEFASRKLFLHFIFSGLEFKIDFDLDNILLNKKFIYKIISSQDSDKTRTLIQLDFKPALDFLPSDHESLILNLSSLQFLFGRMKELNLQTGVNFIDADAVRNLLDGIENGVIKEMNYITAGVLHLYEKMSGANCNQLKVSNEDFALVHIHNITAVKI